MDADTPTTLPPLSPHLFIGDIRLAMLKARLLAINIPSSFAGEGVLVCGPVQSQSRASASPKSKDPKARLTSQKPSSKSSATPELADSDTALGQIAVRKSVDGELVLEGQPGDTFYAVRSLVYSLHAST